MSRGSGLCKDGHLIDVEISAAPDPDASEKRDQPPGAVRGNQRPEAAGESCAPLVPHRQGSDEGRRRLERKLHGRAQQAHRRALALAPLAQSKLGTDRLRRCRARFRRESWRGARRAARARARHQSASSPTAASQQRSRGWRRALPIPVEIATPEQELPQPVEAAAAYYVIAEALANVISSPRFRSSPSCYCRRRERANVDGRRRRRRRRDSAGGSGYAASPTASRRSRDAHGRKSAAQGTRIVAEIPLDPDRRR